MLSTKHPRQLERTGPAMSAMPALLSPSRLPLLSVFSLACNRPLLRSTSTAPHPVIFVHFNLGLLISYGLVTVFDGVHNWITHLCVTCILIELHVLVPVVETWITAV
jgi:hypothetical protein